MSRSLESVNPSKFEELHYRCAGPDMTYAEVLDKELYECFRHLNIKRLSVISCGVAVIRPGFSSYFSNIQYVNFSDNYISGDKQSLHEFIYLQHLVSIDTSRLFNQEYPVCPSPQERYQLASPNKAHDHCMGLYRLPDNLTRIDYSFTRYNLNWIRFCLIPTNNLKYLDISHTILFSLRASLTGFHALEYLNLQFVFLKTFPITSFHDVPKLTTLKLSYNKIGHIIDGDTDGELFRKNTILTSLDLVYCSITYLSDNFIHSIREIRELKLKGNSLQRLDISQFNRLDFLDISFNKFSYLSTDIIHSLDILLKHTNMTIDLTGNPLSSKMACCDIVYLIRWSKTSASFLYNSGDYKCFYGRHEMSFKSLSLHELKDTSFVNSARTYVALIAILTVSILLSVTICVTIYRKSGV